MTVTRPKKSDSSTPPLSKSRFMAGVQCHKRLYLELYHRDFADPISPAQQALFDQGTAVGELARTFVPRGVLIDEDYTRHAAAMERTSSYLSDQSIPAIYEAAFRHDDVRVRVDVLKRNKDGSFGMIEVKSTTKKKPEHVLDTAIQAWVLRNTGIDLCSVELLHLDISYVYPGGKYDPHNLFQVADLTEDVESTLPEIPGLLHAMRKPLRASQSPAIAVGEHCHTPYDCPFITYCYSNQPEHPVTELQRLGKSTKAQLAANGITDINEIPDNFNGLSILNQRIRNSVLTGKLYLDRSLAPQLKNLASPIYFIDFEAFNPAIPRYVNTHPYEMIPFQWSAHRLDQDGSIHHGEYLHRDPTDPRRAVLESLLDYVRGNGAICVYSSFEETQLKSLATALPDHAVSVRSIIDRLVDLLPLIREHVYHPKFHGSYSIKAVLPALVQNYGYSDLEIANGVSAALAYEKLTDPSTPPDDARRIGNHLLNYCARDTEALLRIYSAISEPDVLSVSS
ncbi:MAG: DUF2779 domain-containing protein [Planctomycetes bacterium]|nr:DUF2779 domain-containing protein [Planctomycetota bacterium]